MQLNIKESSNIHSATYVGTTLTVTFHSGGVYSYLNVPASVVEQFVAAESVGKAFHSLIKKGGYVFEKIDGPSQLAV